ncbi:hypothetical protein HIM_00417 [Hirsutella minnesotensis 3608]|nr:hypothetical protein HIM_00417 [Hirsutella minnesotensis 3608]
MGAKAGLALKSLQWVIRGVQLLCAALILGVYSYFLAALHNHRLPIPRSARAVEGISGAAVLYTLVGLVLLCCLAGVAVASGVAVLLDVAFIGAFIYLAVANRHGAGSCTGYLDTPFGSGLSGDVAEGNRDGFTALPSFHTACRLQTACMAVAIIGIFFFIFSILVEVALVRHHRKAKRFGPSPANNYTSGYGGGGFLGRFRRNRAAPADDPNTLPEHTHPNQIDPTRGSGNTEATAVAHDGHAPGSDVKHEAGYGYQPAAGTVPEANGWNGAPHAPQPQPAPASYRYNNGVYDRA